MFNSEEDPNFPQKGKVVEGQVEQAQEKARQLEAKDVKAMFQNHGRFSVADQEHVLVTPSFSDREVQEYAQADNFTITQIGTPGDNGESTYILRAEGKNPLKITVGRSPPR